jgi:hypothetical protein
LAASFGGAQTEAEAACGTTAVKHTVTTRRALKRNDRPIYLTVESPLVT